jgi:hypothetical protein
MDLCVTPQNCEYCAAINLTLAIIYFMGSVICASWLYEVITATIQRKTTFTGFLNYIIALICISLIARGAVRMHDVTL